LNCEVFYKPSRNIKCVYSHFPHGCNLILRKISNRKPIRCLTHTVHSNRKTANYSYHLTGETQKGYVTGSVSVFICKVFVTVSNYSQLLLIYLFYRRSTCFSRLLQPSSGAHNCTYSFRHCQPILLLAVPWKKWNSMEFHLFHGSTLQRIYISSTVAASSSIG
jgi:hypothetical protein